MSGPLHQWDWEPATVALQALSLVEKVEPVQFSFILRLRDQRSMWSLHGFLHGIEWIMIHGHLDYFQKLPLGGRANSKLGDHGTPNAHNHWFILFYHLWGPAWIEIHWINTWLRAWSCMTSHYTGGSMTTLHSFGGVLGQPLDTLFWALTIHGHDSWLVCEVALRYKTKVFEDPHETFFWSLRVIRSITLFKSIILFCRTNNIMHNITSHSVKM